MVLGASPCSLGGFIFYIKDKMQKLSREQGPASVYPWTHSSVLSARLESNSPVSSLSSREWCSWVHSLPSTSRWLVLGSSPLSMWVIRSPFRAPSSLGAWVPDTAKPQVPFCGPGAESELLLCLTCRHLRPLLGPIQQCLGNTLFFVGESALSAKLCKYLCGMIHSTRNRPQTTKSSLYHVRNKDWTGNRICWLEAHEANPL